MKQSSPTWVLLTVRGSMTCGRNRRASINTVTTTGSNDLTMDPSFGAEFLLLLRPVRKQVLVLGLVEQLVCLSSDVQRPREHSPLQLRCHGRASQATSCCHQLQSASWRPGRFVARRKTRRNRRRSLMHKCPSSKPTAPRQYPWIPLQ